MMEDKQNNVKLLNIKESPIALTMALVLYWEEALFASIQEILSLRKCNLLRQHASIIKHDIFNIVSYNSEHMLGYKPDWTHSCHILYFPSFCTIWQHLNWVADIENINIIAFTEIVQMRCTLTCVMSTFTLLISTAIYTLISMFDRGREVLYCNNREVLLYLIEE